MLPSKATEETFKIIVQPLKTQVLDTKPGIHPYTLKYTENAKIAINNLFQDQTNRRFLQSAAGQLTPVKPFSRTPLYLAPVCCSSTSISSVVMWTFVGVSIISITGIGTLVIFQWAQRKRYEKNKSLVDSN